MRSAGIVGQADVGISLVGVLAVAVSEYDSIGDHRRFRAIHIA